MFFDIIFLFGRILYGGFFLLMGMNHFLKLGMLTGYAQSKGVKSPKMAVMLSGALIVLGGAGIIFGVLPKLAAILILAFLFPVSMKIHDFWKIQDPQQKTQEMMSFTRNVAFAGAALMSMAISDWPLSLF